MIAQPPPSDPPGASVADLGSELRARLAASPSPQPVDVVEEIRGAAVVARVPQARIGDVCLLRTPAGEERLGEVVGVEGPRAIIACFDGVRGLCTLTTVAPLGRPLRVTVGDHLLGACLDAFGAPALGSPDGGLGAGGEARPVIDSPPSPLSRGAIREPIATGVAAIDAMLTVGRGQRMGIFGGPGAGKSTLIATLLNACECDVAVVGLIGERGREVREFWEETLGPEGRTRSVVVASTSDRPAVERRLAAQTATAVAEGFRDQGRSVLLVIDSLTRFARAQREIGLAAGEPPARRGFPPSTAGLLAELVERAGPGAERRDGGPGGAITAFYTVLVEGELDEDPVADELRALLDGHIVLSRTLAEAGQFPAIDVLASQSRAQDRIVPREHAQAARRMRRLIAKRREIDLLLQMGEYAPGADALADEAVAKHERIQTFLHGGADGEPTLSGAEAIAELRRLAAPGGA